MTEREAKVRVTVTGNAAQELQKIEGAVRKVDAAADRADTSVKDAGAAISKAGRAAAAASDPVKKFDASAAKVGASMAQAAGATRAASEAAAKYARSAVDGTRAIERFATAENAAVGKTNQLASAHKRLNDEMNRNPFAGRRPGSGPRFDLNKWFGDTNKSLEDSFGNLPFLRKLTSVTDVIEGGVTAGMTVAAAAAAAAVGAFAAGTIGAISEASQLESAMSRVRAATAGSRDEMRQLTAEAARLGAATKYSAAEVAAVQENFAKAGFQVQQIVAATPAAMNFASATGTDTGFASGLMAQTIRSMNFRADQAGTIADALVVGTQASNVDATDLAEAMKYAAPVFSGMAGGQQQTAFRDMVALSGILGDQGIRGSMAGTALRSGYSRLASGQGGASAELRRLGVSATGQDGSMRRLPEILSDLRASLSDKTDAQRQTALSRIFGMNAAGAFGAILNADPMRFQELVNQLDASGGAADRAARVLQDNLSGDLEQLGGAFGGLATTIGNELLPGTRHAVAGFSDVVGALNSAIVESGLANSAFGGFGDMIQTLGDGVAILLEGLVPQVAGFMELIGILNEGEGGRLAEQFANSMNKSRQDRATLQATRERDRITTEEQQRRLQLQGAKELVTSATGATGGDVAQNIMDRFRDRNMGQMLQSPEAQSALQAIRDSRGGRSRRAAVQALAGLVETDANSQILAGRIRRDVDVGAVNIAEQTARGTIRATRARSAERTRTEAESAAHLPSSLGELWQAGVSMANWALNPMGAVGNAVGRQMAAPAEPRREGAENLAIIRAQTAILERIANNTASRGGTGTQDGGQD